MTAVEFRAASADDLIITTWVYKWISAGDGGWDLRRILPDPVYDCRAPNIPAGTTTDCR